MHFEYPTAGVCSVKIQFDVDDGVVHDIQYTGGCNGNTQGLARLAEGMKIDDVISRLRGLRCGMKPTSCPDQLARALTLAKEEL